MWTVENRTRYDRSKVHYPSELTDDEWSLAKIEIPQDSEMTPDSMRRQRCR